MTVAFVSQHVCNVPFMHIAHQCVLHSTVHWIWHSRPVPCLFFLRCVPTISPSCSCIPRVRTLRSEAPQSGLMFGSMYLLSTTFDHLLGHGLAISSAAHNALVHNIFRWTQGFHEDNRLHSRFNLWSLTTCSRWEMFTLNVWGAFQLTLNVVLFLYSCNILSDIYFSFLRCAFVAKMNSSYQEDILSPALIWMMWTEFMNSLFVHITIQIPFNVFDFNEYWALFSVNSGSGLPWNGRFTRSFLISVELKHLRRTF